MPRATASTSVYQVLVTLQRIEPPSWRRLLVPGEIRLGKLHRVLHGVFDWENDHLHQCIVGDTFYGVSDPEWGDDLPMIDERTVPLSRVLPKVGDTMVYEYDLGDGWRHTLLVLSHPSERSRSDLSAVCRRCSCSAPGRCGRCRGLCALLGSDR